VTRNSLLPKSGSDLQVTLVWGWGGIHRADGVGRDRTTLLGVFGAADYPKRTVYFDAAWVRDGGRPGDGLFWGISSVQRIGHVNATFRALGSHALEEESPAVTRGYLLMSELSLTPPWSHDVVYLSAFWGIDRFSSAARGPGTGGPLGRAGFLFAAVGLGGYGSPLDSRPERSLGGALGYQKFLDGSRRQVVVELAGRQPTDGASGEAGLGARFRQALGRRFVVQLDVFGAAREQARVRCGTRIETLVQF
jgi:hypothetical protein